MVAGKPQGRWGLNAEAERIWGHPEPIYGVDKINLVIPMLLDSFSWHVPEADPVLPWSNVVWGGHLDFCFSSFENH